MGRCGIIGDLSLTGAWSSVPMHFPCRQGEICRSSIQSGLFLWSHDLHTRVRVRGGSRCGLQAGSLTPQRPYPCSIPNPLHAVHYSWCLFLHPVAQHCVQSERRAGSQGTRFGFVCPTLRLEYLCGSFVCSVIIY